MKIRKLKLYTNKLELEKKFYSQTLGFKIVENNSNYFTLKIGWSELTFEKTEKEYKYHYCFLIPSNKLEQAMEWMEKRVPIVDIENGRKTQRFENWNADSFYFYDASGNIAEFIVRHDLKNSIKSDFSISNVLCVNEIGMPTNNVEKLNNELQEFCGTKFWKGDIKRFGTNGSQEGMFLLPNYEIKKLWFPSSIWLKSAPFQIQIENNEKIFDLEYKDEKVITTATKNIVHLANSANQLNIMNIENSELTDVPKIFALYGIAIDYMKSKNQVYWPKFPNELVVNEIEEKRQWKLLIDGKIACIWATTLNDDLIWGNNNEPSLYIHRIAANPEFRGQNLVKKLINWANKFGKNKNLEFIRMDTVGLNKGLIRHYEKLGFEFLGAKRLENTNGLPKHYKNGEVCYFQKTII